MMTRFFLLGFLLIPFFSAAQVVDTAAVRVEVDSLVQLSRELVKQSQLEQALEVIESAERTALEAFGKNNNLYAQCLYNHGYTYYLMDKYVKAEPLYLELLSIGKNVLGKEHPHIVASLQQLGFLYYIIGEYDKAEPIWLEFLSSGEKVLGKEHPKYVLCLVNLGALYCAKREYDKAEPLFLESLAIYRKVYGKEHPDYAAGLNKLGSLYYIIGEYDKAEPLLLESLAIYRKVYGKEHPDYGKGLYILGVLYHKKGEYGKTELFYLESLAIREKVLGKEHPDYATSLYSLAFLYSEMGEYNKAQFYYLESLAIREKVLGKEHPDYALGLHSLAHLYRNSGEYNKAQSYYLESLAIQEKELGKEHPDYAMGLNSLAALYWEMDQYNKAEQVFQQAKEICNTAFGKNHPDCAMIQRNLAEIYFYKEKYDKAELIYLDTKAILGKVLGKEHPEYTNILNNLAELYMHKGNYDKAEHFLIESNVNYKHILQKSANYLPSQELEKYIAKYQGKNNVFYTFNHITSSFKIRGGTYNNALFYKEFALETASLLEKAIQNAPDSIRDIHARWKGYNRRLAAELSKPISERQRVAYLDSISTVLEKVLLRAAPAFAEARRQVEWQDVHDALQPGEAAIEFIHYRYSDKKTTDSTMYSALLTISGDEAPHFIPLCEVRQLEAIIYKPMGTRANYLQNLYASPRADGLQSLYQLLWSPIEKLLHEHGIKTVYFSPTGLMHRINLGAISAEKSGMPLYDRYHLVPMGSTRQILSRPGKTVAGSSDEGHVQLSNALIYGGVQYEMDSSAIAIANKKLGAAALDTTGGLFGFANQAAIQRGENWDYLEGTEKEARYLDSLLRLRGISTTLRLGYEATEESFKQIGQAGSSPSLLHIGTHGFFFPDPQDTTRRQAALSDEEPVFKISEFSMIRSGLKLAGSKYAWENGHPLPGGHEDGILTAYEVSQMDLSNTQLVVLSACQTGLGDIKGNEGVYGLQRAFRIAGAKNILMSLWKVPDEATEQLMTRFYKNWLELKMPLREAFESSQKWLREQSGYENPYYWAGFVLIGEI